MATFVLFDEIVNYMLSPALLTGTLNFETNDFRVALTNSAPTQDSYNDLADITQIASGNGYTTVTTGPAGASAANPTVAETGAGTGIWQFTTDDIVFTASGGSIATFRYPVLVDVTVTISANAVLVGYLDYGSAVDLTTGNTFTVNVGTNGWFQITVP